MAKSLPSSLAIATTRNRKTRKVGFFDLPREIRDEIYVLIPAIRMSEKPKCIWCEQKKCLHWERMKGAEFTFDEFPVGFWAPFGHSEYYLWSAMHDDFVRVHHMAYFENPGKLGVSKQFDHELRETLIRNKIFLDMLPGNDWVPLMDDLQRQLTENGEIENIRRLSMDAPMVFVIEIADGEGRELRIRTPRVLREYYARILKTQVQRYLYRPWSRRVGGRLQRGGRLHGRHLFDIARIIKKCERRWIFGYQFETEIKNRDAHTNRLFVEGPEDCNIVFMHDAIQEEPELEKEVKEEANELQAE